MGSVYILTNKSMPGLVKIGFTETQTAQARADQLFHGYKGTAGTGVPTPFEVAHEEFCENPAELEKIVHNELLEFRNCKDEEFEREFFKFSDPSEAIQRLQEIHKREHLECPDTQPSVPQANEKSQIPKTSENDDWRKWTSHFLTRYKRKTIAQQEDVYERDTLS